MLSLANKILLDPAGLTEYQLQGVLSSILGRSIDAADLYFQSVAHESWLMEDGIVKEGSYNLGHGVGVRAILGDNVGFAYSDEIILPALEEAANAARCIANSNTGVARSCCAWDTKVLTPEIYKALDPLFSMSDQEKIDVLKRLDSKARSIDPRVKQVIVSLSGKYEVIYVLASDGTRAADIRPLVRLNIQVIAEHNNRREQGSAGGGGRVTYRDFISDDILSDFATRAVHQALVNLEAIDAPAGVMPVVLGPGWPGVILHEAIGHGLEGDFNRKKTSAFADKLQQQVASPLCTIVDDGTLVGRRGSLNIDDEGTVTQKTVLIENGILKNYMQDKLNAKLMNMVPTGNARRESYAHLPLPRMTNTYMLPGPHKHEEIIASVKRGIYAAQLGGGQVDITSGKFVFNTSEAYMIENGKITHPIKGANLIGDGPQILKKVSMVADNLELDGGLGTCGKNGQSVPVGVGQPTILVDEMTVGGTS